MAEGFASAVTLTDLLYGLCALLLAGSGILIFSRNPRAAVHRTYALTAMTLLGYLLTLFVYRRLNDPASVLLAGRLNFSAALLAALCGYHFVLSVANQATIRPLHRISRPWMVETVVFVILTAVTPLVDRSEIAGSQGIEPRTEYGVLFLVYLLHILIYLGLSVRISFGASGKTRMWNHPRASVRDQLILIDSGIVTTGAVAIVSNAVLPYAFGNFRFIDVGVLSPMLFLIAVGYAIAKHELFDLRRFIRKTLILGLILSLAMAVYSSVVVLVTDKLTQETASGFTRFTVLIIAFSFDPLRRFLEAKVDRLLFSEEKKRR